MTIEELVDRFYHKLNGPDDATAEDAMSVVVRALRDEMFCNRPLRSASVGHHCQEVFNEILGDAGEKVAGGLPDDAVPIPLMHPESAISAPATDAAPAHEWFQFSNLVACRACGVVRRADDKNSPCKGPVRVALRDTNAAPAVCVWTPYTDEPLGANWWRTCRGVRHRYKFDGHHPCASCGKPIRFREVGK